MVNDRQQENGAYLHVGEREAFGAGAGTPTRQGKDGDIFFLAILHQREWSASLDTHQHGHAKDLTYLCSAARRGRSCSAARRGSSPASRPHEITSSTSGGKPKRRTRSSVPRCPSTAAYSRRGRVVGGVVRHDAAFVNGLSKAKLNRRRLRRPKRFWIQSYCSYT